MTRKRKEEELSKEEKEELIKILQKNCKHKKGYITNTSGPSICFQCGKSWMECESEKNSSS